MLSGTTCTCAMYTLMIINEVTLVCALPYTYRTSDSVSALYRYNLYLCAVLIKVNVCVSVSNPAVLLE